MLQQWTDTIRSHNPSMSIVTLMQHLEPSAAKLSLYHGPRVSSVLFSRSENLSHLCKLANQVSSRSLFVNGQSPTRLVYLLVPYSRVTLYVLFANIADDIVIRRRWLRPAKANENVLHGLYKPHPWVFLDNGIVLTQG